MSDEMLWSVATAEDDGKPLLLRVLNRPPAFAHQDQFPHLLAIAWPYEPTNDDGMPSEDVYARMNELEDLLTETLENSQHAFLSVIVTGHGVREWQWYTRSPEQAMELINKSLGHKEPFPVEFSAQDDPAWSGYARFRGLIEGGEADAVADSVS